MRAVLIAAMLLPALPVAARAQDVGDFGAGGGGDFGGGGGGGG